jgi:3' terminal RNA ribose 2'-O-methyltransferase Hen1
VGDDEVDKLLAKGKEWLKDHPAKEAIVRRYLKYRAELTHKALSQLQVDLATDEDSDGEEMALEQAVDSQLPAAPSGADVACVLEEEEKKPRLQEVRHNTVLAALRDPAADIRSVLDIGCAGGHFLRTLAKERRFERIAGMDVSVQALQHAAKRLWLKQGRDSDRLTLLHGSLLYRDRRLAGFDAITLIEVIEHLDPPRLRAAERVIFEQARPRMVLVTTPNIEYNVVWAELPAGTFRHRDHRFEWTRSELADWCARLSTRFGYSFTSHEIGPRSIEHPAVGTPTQMAVFRRTADR